MPCSKSRDTVLRVSECPKNEMEWKARARLINCSSVPQACVEPKDFQYHCVLNENATEMIEVCASTKTIHGILF